MSYTISGRLIRLGVLLLVFGVFWLRRRLAIRSARKGIATLQNPEYREISVDALTEADQELFRRAKQELASLGFTCLGEFERADFRSQGNFCASSVWVSSDKRIIGEISQLEKKAPLAKLSSAGPTSLKRVAFVSPFVGGDKFQSSTLVSDMKVPGVTVLKFSPETPLKEQYQAHLSKLEQLIGESSQVSQLISSIAEYFDYTNNSQQKLAKHLERRLEATLHPSSGETA